MTISTCSLIFAGSLIALTPAFAPAFAQSASADKPARQAPVAPVAPGAPGAPVAPNAPNAPNAPEIALDPYLFELHSDLARELVAKMKHLEVEIDVKMLEKQAKLIEKEARLLALRQFPVPPVPPVPPRDPREKPRERDRRRIPEGWVESTEPFTRSFPVGKAATLMLSNIAGNIQIVPGAADRIEVDALKHVWGPNAEQSKQRLGDATVEAYASGNRVELRVEHTPRKDARNVEVEFNVKVPADASIDLRTVSGDIRVTNVKGEVRVQGVSGNVALEGTARLASVKTVNGGITLTNAGSDTQLSLSTVNGDLMIQTLNARALDINTINGDVHIAGWSGDRAHVRSLDGDLNLQTSLTKGGRYEIESHSGDINLSLPDQPGFELEAHTFNGRIRIDFPIRSEGPIRDSDRGPRTVRGTYGDSSSSLRLQTFNGDLTVTKR